MSQLIFISGVHGVGKSTLCEQLNKHVKLPAYSCSDLIKKNSSYVEKSKFIGDELKDNQSALLKGLKSLRGQSILLDGHFCLLGDNSNIIELEYGIFDDIAPSVIINVIAEASQIHERLKMRDGRAMDISLIEKLQDQECFHAHNFGNSRGITVVNYRSGNSISDLLQLIN